MYNYCTLVDAKVGNPVTLNIGVVGGGVAGLSAAWFLSKRHNVTLYEANEYIGGHTHTVEVPTADGGALPVDTGFIVYNEPNYPLLTRLFTQLGVKTQNTQMSFSVSVNGGQLEYSGSGAGGLFAQPANIVRPAHWRMLRDIMRFNREAKNTLESTDLGSLSLADFLARGKYGSAMINRYLLPMGAAIWSCPTTAMEQFPASSFLRFFSNHGLLDLRNRPQWKSVTGGSCAYVNRLLAISDFHLKSGCSVESVDRTQNHVVVRTKDGTESSHDLVVYGCHADQALRTLTNPTPDEDRILKQFRYEKNYTYLHQDSSLMPVRPRTWSSWNYLARDDTGSATSVSVTYWMNQLQRLPSKEQYFVSLNPLREPQYDKVIAQMIYEHPVFDECATRAQHQLPLIQGRDRIWFCGSYTGYGFHEDALRSSVKVAQSLGAAPEWTSSLPPNSALSGNGIPSPVVT